MSAEALVHSWPCSYYVNEEKRWTSGRLSLTPSAVRFSPAPGTPSASLLLPLRQVTNVDTATSCLIYSAITLQERDGPKHWFSSVKPSAAAVHLVLQHFWKNALSANSDSAHIPLSTGQRLLSMVTDAQQHLTHAGRTLSHQGEQFQHMTTDLDTMQADLGVADRLLSELETPAWWPFAKLPWSRRNQSEVSKAECKAPPTDGCVKPCGEVVRVPVVFYRGGDVTAADVSAGSLLVLTSGLEVRDANDRLVHHFRKQEVDEVRIHGACDVSVRQRFIGKPDVCFRLLSARMGEVRPLLDIQYKKKVELARNYTPPLQTTPTDDITAGTSALCGAEVRSDSVGPVPVPVGELPLVQVQLHRSSVSEEEAQELKQMLVQLRSLALEAESELDRQDEVLDELMSSTERAVHTMDKHSHRMRKLL